MANEVRYSVRTLSTVPGYSSATSVHNELAIALSRLALVPFQLKIRVECGLVTVAFRIGFSCVGCTLQHGRSGAF